MGNSSSKVTRAFPKPSPAPWSGARTPPLAARASERRTAGEETTDARDPDFLAALNRLGPVRVNQGGPAQPGRQPTTSQDTRMNQNITRLFQSRTASEDEASSFQPAHNHLYAGSLHQLLDERKAARTQGDLSALARKYGMDGEKMERVARVVTSPSVDSGLTVKKVDKDGNVLVTLTAVWANPVHIS